MIKKTAIKLILSLLMTFSCGGNTRRVKSFPLMIVKTGLINNSIELPRSKSYTNRALILASQKGFTSEIHYPSKSLDSRNLIDCLKAIGLDITEKSNSVLINNTFPECEKGNCNIEVYEGGTTLRFLISLLALGSKEYHIKIGPRLAERPIKPLLDALTSLGVNTQLTNERISIQGPIRSGEIEVDSTQSSQFLSALL